VPFPEVEYLGRPISSTDIAIRAHLSLGRLTALVVGNRLSIMITALTQHRDRAKTLRAAQLPGAKSLVALEDQATKLVG